MLNGISPVVIFTFYKDTDETGKKIDIYEIKKKSLLEQANYIKVPIPVYLSETVLGIATEYAERTLAINTQQDGEKAYQNPLLNDTVIRLSADRDNVIFSTLLTLLEYCYTKLTRQLYSITLYYDDTFMFDAVIRDMSVSGVDNTTKKELTITLTNRPDKELSEDKKKNPVEDKQSTAEKRPYDNTGVGFL